MSGGGFAVAPYEGMSNDVPHPSSITVEPLKKLEGQFGWALRRSGRLVERSDRTHPTEATAFENAMKAIERNQSPHLDRRR